MSFGSWVNPSPEEIGSCGKRDRAAAGGEGGGSVGVPQGEIPTSTLVPGQSDGNRGGGCF